MLESKSFEFRCSGRYVPFLAVKLNFDNPNDHEVLRIARLISAPPEVILVELRIKRVEYFPNGWSPAPEYVKLHRYIRENFDKLETGGVIDYESIK